MINCFALEEKCDFRIKAKEERRGRILLYFSSAYWDGKKSALYVGGLMFTKNKSAIQWGGDSVELSCAVYIKLWWWCSITKRKTVIFHDLQYHGQLWRRVTRKCTFFKSPHFCHLLKCPTESRRKEWNGKLCIFKDLFIPFLLTVKHLIIMSWTVKWICQRLLCLFKLN